MKYVKSSFKSADVLKSVNPHKENCIIKDGVLFPLFAPQKLCNTALKEVKSAKYARGVDRFLVYADGVMYYSKDCKAYFNGGYSDGEVIFLDEYRGEPQGLMLSGGYVGRLNKNGAFSGYSNRYKFHRALIKNNRLFGIDAADRTMLRWYAVSDGEILDWSSGTYEAGYVHLDPERGLALDMAVFEDKLIILREHGITVMNVHGNPENFVMENTDTDVLGTVANTAAVVGDKLFFMAVDGLKYFKNNRIETAECREAEAVLSPANACAYGNMYVVACTFKNTEEPSVFVYDTVSGEACFLNLGASAFAIKDKLYALCSKEIYILENGGNFVFESGGIDFESVHKKRLSAIEIKADNPVDVEISNGRIKRVFTGVKSRLSADIAGVNFKITVRGSGKVYSIKAYAEVADGI